MRNTLVVDVVENDFNPEYPSHSFERSNSFFFCA